MSIALRPLCMDDAAQVRAWRNAPHVAAHMYTDHEVGEAEHARWLDGVLAASDSRYWIVVVDDRPAGLASLVRIDEANRRCEWGYYLGEPEARGSGAGMAALYLLAVHAFETLDLNRLSGAALAENEAACGLYESMGFVREGRLREAIWKSGRFMDVIVYALLAREWPAARTAIAARLHARGRDPAAFAILEA